MRLVLMLCGVAAWAQAQPAPRGVRVAAYALLPDYGLLGLGGGLTVSVPLVDEGLFASLDDELALNAGFDVGFNLLHLEPYGFVHFFAPLAIEWRLHLHRAVMLFVRLGAGLGISPRSPTELYPFPATSLGLDWLFSRFLGLRIDVGYPGARLGLVLALP